MPPLCLTGRNKTGTDRPTIEKNRASTTITSVASNLCSPQPDLFAKQITKPRRWLAANALGLAIHRQTKINAGICDAIHHAASAQSNSMVRQAISAAACRR